MLIDSIAFILLLLALFKGISKGFIIALFSFLAFFIGLAAALKLLVITAGYIGDTLSVSQKWLPFLTFLFVFLLVFLLVRLGARLLQNAVQAAMLGWLNRMTGVLLYLFIYLFIFSILLFYATQLHLLTKKAIEASVMYAYIEPLGPSMIDLLSKLIPLFKNMFSTLLHFFDAASHHK